MASIYPIVLDDGSEPDTGSDVVTPVSQGTSATDVDLTPEHNGDQVGNNGAGTFAWDCQDLTELVSYLEGVRQTAAEAVGPLAITQPEIMHVRLGPDLGYDVVTTVPQGTQARIIGIGPQNEWYQVDLDELNIPGWIFQDMSELDGSLEGVRQVTAEEIAQLPISGAPGSRPLAVTQPEIMNVRLGPGLDYDVVTTVPHGTEAKILGIDPSREWLQIELDGLEPLGWVYRDMIQVDCPLANVRRITEQEIAVLPAAIIQPRVVHARSGPGADYDVITILTKGTWAKIIAIGPQEKWFQVEVVGLDVPVWVDRCLTKVAGGSLASVRRYTTAEITPPPAEGSEDGKPLAVTLPITLNVRLGAGPGPRRGHSCSAGDAGSDLWHGPQPKMVPGRVGRVQHTDLDLPVHGAGGRFAGRSQTGYGARDYGPAGRAHPAAGSVCAVGAGHGVRRGHHPAEGDVGQDHRQRRAG